ncbi:hypothetical protein CHLRE_09g406200v5 [Chlamydomonas reinhardtii]|uniref:proline--tRNA ligase n=1 Tax=Chlamydomonas reinhardtii TaxID=3055 RepID=A0A2K3DFA0_CHLRE|nr:uncharacterized protein CHLRE_09g406200v5 [Chlamydomonas reinhardtii]PNW79206.1 hypothetical protein CHLRE_09g406200v5 [Chlamydomonas reinhardtii]
MSTLLARGPAPAGAATTRSSASLRACRGPAPFRSHFQSVVASAAPAAQDAPAPEKPQKQQKQQQQKKQGGGGGGGGGGKAAEAAVTPRSEDFSKWYLDVVAKAELADYGPVRGTMVIRPYGYSIWESVQGVLDARFKELGVQNAYFPQLIPYSFITKEAEHVEGFAPELALVTKGGGKDLEEPLVVRPTSETIINHMFAQWVQSYRDLPLLINQWCNVHRWEMRTRPFVRTLEFLWQEGHTAHATAEEAEAEARAMIDVYTHFATHTAAMPVVPGRKSRIESFAGANCTYTIEAMMGDKRALQAGTSHNLGTNFAKAFNTQYLDKEGKRQLVHQTSWGVSTRIIGGVIMTHGDDKGLRLPPRLAPIQVVIIPIVKKEEDRVPVNEAAARLAAAAKAAGIRVKVDMDERQTPGWKYNHWEMRGVPVRVEVGPKDVQSGTCVTARRDMGKEGKQMGVPMEAAAFTAHVQGLLDTIQEGLLAQARAFRDDNIVDVTSYEQLKAAVAEGKWARGGWSGSDDDERRIKEETQATLRCFPFEQPAGPHTCFMTGQAAAEVAIFAKSY